MKKIVIPAFLLTASIILFGCTKNQTRVTELVPLDGKAFVKINYAMAYTVNSSAQLKVNGNRVSTLLTFPYPFPGGGLNTGGASNPDYLALDGTKLDLVVSRPNVGTLNDSIVLFSSSYSGLAAGKNYTLHLTDTATKATGFVIEDNIAQPDSGFSRFKFVNMVPNQASLDLYYGTTKVASGIAYKSASPEFTIPVSTSTAWAIRPAGAASTTTALASYSAAVADRRVLTVFASGYTGAATPRAARVSLLYNR